MDSTIIPITEVSNPSCTYSSMHGLECGKPGQYQPNTRYPVTNGELMYTCYFHTCQCCQPDEFDLGFWDWDYCDVCRNDQCNECGRGCQCNDDYPTKDVLCTSKYAYATFKKCTNCKKETDNTIHDICETCCECDSEKDCDMCGYTYYNENDADWYIVENT